MYGDVIDPHAYLACVGFYAHDYEIPSKVTTRSWANAASGELEGDSNDREMPGHICDALIACLHANFPGQFLHEDD